MIGEMTALDGMSYFNLSQPVSASSCDVIKAEEDRLNCCFICFFGSMLLEAVVFLLGVVSWVVLVVGMLFVVVVLFSLLFCSKVKSERKDEDDENEGDDREGVDNDDDDINDNDVIRIKINILFFPASFKIIVKSGFTET